MRSFLDQRRGDPRLLGKKKNRCNLSEALPALAGNIRQYAFHDRWWPRGANSAYGAKCFTQRTK